MADVKIRKLDEGVVASFRARAKAAGHSLEEELRRTLTEVARERRLAYVEKLRTLQKDLREAHGEMPDSTSLIREDRDQRG
jgi:plasmid stability protein